MMHMTSSTAPQYSLYNLSFICFDLISLWVDFKGTTCENNDHMSKVTHQVILCGCLDERTVTIIKNNGHLCWPDLVALSSTTFTRQVSSMIHSARPMVTPVTNIVFCCFVFLYLKCGDGWTDGQHVRKQ